jgi:hypothetical protein
MKLTEALEILKGVKSRKGDVFTCFLTTERNSPLREFLTEVLGDAAAPGCVISRRAFEARAKIVPIPQEITNG